MRLAELAIAIIILIPADSFAEPSSQPDSSSAAVQSVQNACLNQSTSLSVCSEIRNMSDIWSVRASNLAAKAGTAGEFGVYLAKVAVDRAVKFSRPINQSSSGELQLSDKAVNLLIKLSF